MMIVLRRPQLVKVLLIFLASVQIATGQRIKLSGPFETEECRRCVDHFYNSYYCTSAFSNTGTCCPYPTEKEGLPDSIDTRCLHSIQLGQTCSHKLEAAAIGTSLAIDQRSFGIESYYVCYNEETQCGQQTVLEISIPSLKN